MARHLFRTFPRSNTHPTGGFVGILGFIPSFPAGTHPTGGFQGGFPLKGNGFISFLLPRLSPDPPVVRCACRAWPPRAPRWAGSCGSPRRRPKRRRRLGDGRREAAKRGGGAQAQPHARPRFFWVPLDFFCAIFWAWTTEEWKKWAVQTFRLFLAHSFRK